MSRWKAMYIVPEHSPCKDCNDRSASCHGSCSMYVEYQAMCQNVRKQRQLRREVDYAVADAMKPNSGEKGDLNLGKTECGRTRKKCYNGRP